jgi:NAD(P)-dependent dehydrogenase (short-subunit alcohol dehydrogenase family)
VRWNGEAIRLKPIEQQVVVVMGASSGIGRETALRFARRGARVVLAARGESALRSLKDEIRAEGGEATVAIADVTAFEQMRAVVDITVERYGRLDTWAHVAGVGMWATLEASDPEEWRRVVDVNLTGVAFAAKAALPHLKQSGGALIVVTSGEARIAVPLQSAYGASKHGADALIKSLRIELQHERAPVSVTQVMPSGTNTPIFNHARTCIGVKPQPLPPLYAPGLVADAILYAAEHPTKEIVVGGAGKLFMLLQGLSPALVDSVMLSVGFPLQRTQEPKAPDAPSNLFEPRNEDHRVFGDFSVKTRCTSLYTWMERHPPLLRAAKLAALGSAAYLLFRQRRTTRP